MTMRRLLAVISLALLASCGSTDNTVYTISTGVYDVSSGTAAAADGCEMVQYFVDPTPGTDPSDDPLPIGITVTDAQAVIDMAYESGVNPPAGSLVTTTITGNSIANTTAADYNKAVAATTCQYRQQMTVDGDITANDEVALTVVYTKTVNQGYTCTNADLGITATGDFTTCTSSVHFLGKKQ